MDSYLRVMIAPPPEGAFWLTSSVGAPDAVISDAAPSGGEGVTELSNT